MDNLFNEDEMVKLLAELETENNAVQIEDNPEMEAAQRRYTEIIKKHKENY